MSIWRTLYSTRSEFPLCSTIEICRPVCILISEQSCQMGPANEALQNEPEEGNCSLVMVVLELGPQLKVRVLFNEVFRRGSGADGSSSTTSNLPPAQVRGVRSYSRRTLARHANETSESVQRTRTPNVDSQLVCWICFSRTLEVYFEPCGHLVLCAICSERCDFCPACR